MISIKEALEITKGSLILGKSEGGVSDFTVDSRTVKSGGCFVAVKGEHLDGGDFIIDAVKNGAAAVLSDAAPKDIGAVEILAEGGASYIKVQDISVALEALAAYYREKYIKKVAAVTGSVGKTTVKELIFSILKEKISVFKTDGNKNNLLGLPLTILSGGEEENAVLELGISIKGEMERLTKIAKPDVSVITNIENMHLEHLGSKNGVAEEKLKIISGMKEDGVLIINGDEPLLSSFSGLPKNTVTVSRKNKNADYSLFGVTVSGSGTAFDILKNGKPRYKNLFVPIVGMHGAYNAALAVAASELFGCSEENIRAGLKSYLPTGDRQKTEMIGDTLFIYDCYNAGPASFAAALDGLMVISSEKRAKNVGIVAGSMLELGDLSKKEHFSLGVKIAKMHPGFLITVGKEAENIARGALFDNIRSDDDNTFKGACETEKDNHNSLEGGYRRLPAPKLKVSVFQNENDIESVAEELKRRLNVSCSEKADDGISGEISSVVLIKGSRRLRLERLREFLHK